MWNAHIKDFLKDQHWEEIILLYEGFHMMTECSLQSYKMCTSQSHKGLVHFTFITHILDMLIKVCFPYLFLSCHAFIIKIHAIIGVFEYFHTSIAY